ncbi:hypothetical protein OEZ85_009989 [Tetradesmus obliquus]|uniref:P-type phospholipid transporter n=1 Tax=Tetradesmus obliquus TaxID=3088 RepID=A0ABY8UFU2_TETOB|nr:hypothetical protein OEZ85_009989 [Tetradesmus obliquus]
MYAATQVDHPSWQLHWLLSCKAHHPAWAEMVWDEADVLGLITEEYRWFMPTYQTYGKHVIRSDLARFVILHKHGGVYLDADVECYKNMEPSLAGLDLVLNCRTFDVAHNAAMASVAGHPVWIAAMRAAAAVVQRLTPLVSNDPLTASGPVLLSQTVQRYYGITTQEFCENLHVKGGLVLKAYPKGQWFTPCWPWANVMCYKKLEIARKFMLVPESRSVGHLAAAHMYEADLLGLGQPPPAAAAGAQQRQGQQQQQQPVGDLLDFGSSSSLPSVQPLTGPSGAAAAAGPLGDAASPARRAAAAASGGGLARVLSLRGSGQPGRSGSLGYGDLIVLEDESADHPLDAPEGADATRILAGEDAPLPAGMAAGRAAGNAVGRAGSSRRGFKSKRQEVVGVHGGDAHAPEDEQTRNVQVQTISGEGVLTQWQRLLKAAGVRRRRPPGAFISNELVTSKYNALSFVPVNLYTQFKRVANMYFLALVCLQAIPGLSPVPWWGTLFPLAVVLLVNGVKEAFDDFWRHKADEQVNHRFVTTLKEDGDQRIYWKTLQVGDLVRLSNDEDIPADIVLLASSDPDGLCYVETANLDGETNLKVKFCHPGTASFDCAEAFSRAGYFSIECEAPNPRLYSFQGAICCWDFPPTYNPHPSIAPSRQATAVSAAAATARGSGSSSRQEVEMAAAAAGPATGGGSGWYASAGRESEQQQQQGRGSPKGRGGSSSPSRRRQAAGRGGGGADSVTAALGEYGQQVGLVYREPLSASNLLLRGCTLRKTEWVIGAVIFTGPDTKVVRNMLPAPRKVTRLEAAMNRVVVVVLAALGTAALCLATANMVWEGRHSYRRDWYLGRQVGWPELPPGIAGWLVQVVRFVILLAQAVPISLYVSLETVKVAQCKLLYDRDRAMYYAPEDVPATSRTTTLNEELGQVQYVLSDKTGTLTQNIMGFVWASVGGKLFGHTQHAQQAAQHAAAAAAAAAAARQADSSSKGGSKGGSSSNLQQQGKQGKKQGAATAVGSGGGAGGVVIEPGAGALPPPNTPHTIALDEELRAAAAAAAAAADSDLQKAGSTAAAAGEAAAVGEFLLALALCNTVVPTATDAGRLLYQAASPDEEALVAGAAYLGTKLLSRSAAGIEVEVQGQLVRYELLAVLEFSSDRKRMSVVVRCPAGQLRLISKGADNVMLARLAGAGLPAEQQALQQPLLASTSAHLSQMSEAGYRTLVVASKPLQEQQYEAWAEQYKSACASMGDRNSQVAAVCEAMECDLTLLGATAVEDKLQDGVPQSITALVAAGMKVWVLTGDKVETAISIGHTARLLNPQMALLKVSEADLTSSSAASAAAAAAAVGGGPASRGSGLWLFGRSGTSGGGSGIAGLFGGSNPNSNPNNNRPGLGLSSSSPGGPASAALRRMWAAAHALRSRSSTAAAAAAAAESWLQLPAGGAAAVAGVGLVIDGAALAVALQPQHEDELLALCKECRAVICCRVSPMQKAQVASLLKHKAGAVTLAIGDGANDVSMIQAAHIGVGISGREGRAAVQAADFAFGQFRFLVRLLLLHGRQSYLRCREVVLYAFYKNVAYVSCYVFYSFYSGFSAQSIFFPLYIATFNALWAAFPSLGFGLLEQDVPGRLALTHPCLYDETRLQTESDFYRAWLLWVCLGLWHGFACFYVPTLALGGWAGVSASGSHASVEQLGTAVMTAILVTVTLRVAIRTTHWTAINHGLIWGTLALWLPFLALLQGLCGSVPSLNPLCGLGPELLGSAGFWLGAVLGAPAVALLADYTIMVFQRQVAPRASQLLQEAEHMRKQALKKGLAASPAAAAAGQQPASVQLPTHGPDVEPQLRQQQQQQQQQQQTAAAARRQQQQQQPGTAGGGIIAIASVSNGDGGSAANSSANLLAGGAAAAAAGGGWGDQSGLWGPSGGGGAAGFNVGADYNLGGPHTLGDMAAVEWAPNFITASPATLAASHTKMQLRAPLSRLARPGAMSAGGAAAAGGGAGLTRPFTLESDPGVGFGRPAAATAGGIAMQPLPPAQQQQQQQPASSSGVDKQVKQAFVVTSYQIAWASVLRSSRPGTSSTSVPMRRLQLFAVIVAALSLMLAEVRCGTGPASYMFEGPPKALNTDHLVAPKLPKEFEEKPTKWHSDAADEAAHRKLQGVDGGVSGPASWQYYHPLNAKVWQKMQPALPRDTRETHGGTARRLAGVDGGVSGPASWQYYHPLNAKVWQKMQPALPRDTRETHGGTARRLAGVDGGVSGPASWQYYHPLNAKVWQKMQPALPRDTRETHGGTARRLAAVDGDTGPASYAFGPVELPKRGQLPREPTFERHAFPKWVVNPAAIARAAEKVDRKLLDGGATGPASELSAIGAVPIDLPYKGELPTVPDFEHRAKNGPIEEGEEVDGGARLLLGGGGSPDSWQRWGGKPEFEKVWQASSSMPLPRGRRETHGGARRLQEGGTSGPASWHYYQPLNAKIWQKMQPALPRDIRETHGGTARRLAGIDSGGHSGPSAEMFGPVELPKRTKLPTEPDFERRAVTKPDQVQKPEARIGGARLLLGGGGGPDSWQRWGGKPEFEKVTGGPASGRSFGTKRLQQMSRGCRGPQVPRGPQGQGGCV